MHIFRALAFAGTITLAATGAVQAHTFVTETAAAPHKTIKAVSVDANNGIYAWSPRKLTIKVGTKVTWTNPSDVGHDVTSETSGWKFSKTLEIGATVSHTFKKAGTYKYQCTMHPGMKGKIVVIK